MRLLRMVIVPLIFTSIVYGVASIGDGKALGRLGAKTLLWYTLTSLLTPRSEVAVRQPMRTRSMIQAVLDPEGDPRWVVKGALTRLEA